MDDTEQVADLMITLRPLYTELVALKIAINAIKQKRPADAIAIDQMLEYARNNEDTAKQVDIELADLAKTLSLMLSAAAPTLPN